MSIEIAEGIKVRAVKSTINNVIAKTQPVNETQKEQKSESAPKLSVIENTKKSQPKNAKVALSKADTKKPTKPKK